MHTYENYNDDTIHVSISHNSDLSGYVTLKTYDGLTERTMLFPGDALLEFVLGYLASREVSHIEQLTTAQLMERYAGTTRR